MRDADMTQANLNQANHSWMETPHKSGLSDEETALKLDLISIITRMTFEELSNPAIRETILNRELEERRLHDTQRKAVNY